MGSYRSAKTAQRIIRWLIVIGVLALVGFGVKVALDGVMKPKILISLGKATFNVELAQTDAELEKGLSGRTELLAEEAMLFDFSEDGNWQIWMKGMKIPIDIIWLDKNYQVVHFERNVQPDAEPYDTYEAPVPSRYILETKAGSVEKFDIKKNMKAKIYDEDEAEG